MLTARLKRFRKNSIAAMATTGAEAHCRFCALYAALKRRSSTGIQEFFSGL